MTHMDITIGEILGKSNPRMDYRYGMEIEAEYLDEQPSFGNFHDRIPTWNMTTDDSLRNGVEMISDPLSARRLAATVSTVYDYMEERRFTSSPRTGIHLHANQQRRTINEVLALACAYTLYEPMLMQRCGPDRIENVYCVPMYELRSSITEVVRTTSFRNGFQNTPRSRRSFGRRMVGQWAKYTAFNILPLMSHGTVEYRMPPFWQDRQHTIDFIMSVHELQQFTSGRTPADIMRRWGTTDADNLALLAEMSPTAFGWCDESRLLDQLELIDPGGAAEAWCGEDVAAGWVAVNTEARGENGMRHARTPRRQRAPRYRRRTGLENNPLYEALNREATEMREDERYTIDVPGLGEVVVEDDDDEEVE